MSKKTFTIIIGVVFIIVCILIWYFLFSGGGATQTGPGNNQQNLFPFGPGSATNGGKGNNGQNGNATTTINLGGPHAPATPRLRHISFVPTAGAVAFDISTSTNATTTTTVFIRWIERATGHIFETPSESLTVNEISNTTIPKIHEALWSSDGNNVILRYLKDDQTTIRTFWAKVISGVSPEKAMEGSFFPDDINNVSVFGNKLFYVKENPDGAQGIEANIDGSSKVEIFDSTFGDWASAWDSKDVALFPRPSGAATGGIYLLDSKTGQYTKEIGDIPGLSGIFNADETYLLYSGKNGDYFGTAAINIATGIGHDAGVATLSDKCVWSQKQKTIIYCAVPHSPVTGIYPDDWYKGKVSFNDSMWKVDVAAGTTENVFDPELEAGVTMDMMNLGLDQREDALIFTNKDDMTVWRYDLNR